MLQALEQAKKALEVGEVPVGCVFIKNDAVKARAHNETNKRGNGISHCEFVAFEELFQEGHVNLKDFTLYVTLEPCVMCAAMLRERGVKNVFFGAKCSKFGGNGSILNLQNTEAWPTGSGYDSKGGFHIKEAVSLLETFYKRGNENLEPELRNRRRHNKRKLKEVTIPGKRAKLEESKESS